MASTTKMYQNNTPNDLIYSEVNSDCKDINQQPSDLKSLDQHMISVNTGYDVQSTEDPIPLQYQKSSNEELIFPSNASPKYDKPELQGTKSQVIAITILVLNILFPGIGTIVLGLTVKTNNMSKWILKGIFQVLLSPLIIGWVWAILTSVEFWKEKMN